MQDPSAHLSVAGAGGGGRMNIKQPAFPEHEQLKCPRCDSSNTKFCYYNNYNLSQPRHFCKNCRRYWTKGGALRNIPVGGGSRKNSKKPSSSGSAKRSSSCSSSALSASSATSSNTALLNGQGVQNIAGPKTESGPIQMWVNQGNRGGAMDMNANANANVNADVSGGFSSLLASNGQFGNLFENMGSNGASPGLRALEFGEFGENLNLNSGTDTGRASGLELQSGDVPADGFLALQNGDSTCWNGTGNGWPDLAIYTPGSTYQ